MSAYKRVLCLLDWAHDWETDGLGYKCSECGKYVIGDPTEDTDG